MYRDFKTSLRSGSNTSKIEAVIVKKKTLATVRSCIEIYSQLARSFQMGDQLDMNNRGCFKLIIFTSNRDDRLIRETRLYGVTPSWLNENHEDE